MAAKYTRLPAPVTQVGRRLTGIMQSNDTMVQLLCISRATNFPAMNATVTIPDLVSSPVYRTGGTFSIVQFSWIIIVAPEAPVVTSPIKNRFAS